ncbi:MBL fold metallo-hydrolase, partial [Elusimicrobiota bacterium]
MKLKVWGARGSISVSGRQYLKYGGDTTCLELETKNKDVIILDAGTGIRALGNKLLKENRKSFHILLTHSHWDHVLGIPFFKPLYRKDCRIYFHGCTFAQASIKTILKETLRAPFFPVNLHNVAAKLIFDRNCPLSFKVCGLKCHSMPLSHPNQGYGFIIEEKARKFGFFPDNEPGFPHFGAKSVSEYIEAFKEVDILIHDGEYLPEEYRSFSKGWGHSMYLNTVAMAMKSGVKKLVLWHHNQEHSDKQIDTMLKRA